MKVTEPDGRVRQIEFEASDIPPYAPSSTILEYQPCRPKGSLWAWEPVRGNPPGTRHDAAPSRERMRQLQDAILTAAQLHGPGTEEEFAVWTNIPRPSISPQFRPMIRVHLLIDVIDPATGKKLKKKNSSGKLALVRGLPNA